MSETNKDTIHSFCEKEEEKIERLEQNFVNLPDELEVFEKLIKECAENAKKHDEQKSNQCLALFRCIPNTDRETWDNLSKDLNYKEWLTLDIDLENISAQGFMEAIATKNQEYQQNREDNFDHNRIKQAKCLVQAHEKQFLFFGTL